jgi:hypothetical protein
MESGEKEGFGKLLHYSLAGLEAGMLGGLAMLGWFFLVSLANGEPAWRVPDLLGSTFYGDRAFDGNSKMVTVSGVALHLFTSGILGVLFGLFVREMRNYFRVALLGLILGLGWYYLSYAIVWKRLNPLIPLYSSYRSMLVAHFLFGAFLGGYPRCLRVLRRNSRQAQAEQESIVRGEDVET